MYLQLCNLIVMCISCLYKHFLVVKIFDKNRHFQEKKTSKGNFLSLSKVRKGGENNMVVGLRWMQMLAMSGNCYSTFFNGFF